jgi:hypothetical protein
LKNECEQLFVNYNIEACHKGPSKMGSINGSWKYLHRAIMIERE